MNTDKLWEELAWLGNIWQSRFNNSSLSWEEISNASLAPAHDENDLFSQILIENKLDSSSRAILALTISAELDPHQLILTNDINEEVLQLAGGARVSHIPYLLPTAQTACFLIGGVNAKDRFETLKLLGDQQTLVKEKLIVCHKEDDLPLLAARMGIHPNLMASLLSGKESEVYLPPGFPAQQLTSKLAWSDLIIDEATKQQIEQLIDWVSHREALKNIPGLSKHLKPGYKCLFHGESGTGKTLAATLIGKLTGKPVFRIDLSMISSKYVGETEKNLAQVFSEAENKDWILFFDEADALFGKRSATKDAHDRYANQEVSYLLQRVEEYEGLVILSSNFKTNIDSAFTRRFKQLIPFKAPKTEERRLFWKSNIPTNFTIDEDKVIEELAQRAPLTGAGIINAIEYACLYAAKRGEQELHYQDLVEGARQELLKQGKSFSR